MQLPVVAHICNPSTLEGIYMMCSKKTDASKTQMNIIIISYPKYQGTLDGAMQ